MSWLKSMAVYGLLPSDPNEALKMEKFHREALEELLKKDAFEPCGEDRAVSTGWGAVHEGMLVYSSGNHRLLSFVVEKKSVPGSAVKLALAAALQQFKNNTGHAAGRIARKELKLQVVDQLTSRALPVRKTTAVWIDTYYKRVVVDSTSNAIIEAVAHSLGLTTDTSMVQLPLRHPPMTEWLAGEPPALFTVDDFALLELPGEKGTTIRYDKADLDRGDIADILSDGADVTQLAMTFDDSISFVLDYMARFKKITPLQIVDEKSKDVDAFENDFVLMTTELTNLINAMQAELKAVS